MSHLQQAWLGQGFWLQLLQAMCLHPRLLRLSWRPFVLWLAALAASCWLPTTQVPILPGLTVNQCIQCMTAATTHFDWNVTLSDSARTPEASTSSANAAAFRQMLVWSQSPCRA